MRTTIYDAVGGREALGEINEFTRSLGDESEVVRLQSGNGEHHEMDERAQDCFAQAIEDAGISADPPLRETLKAYFRWETSAMSAYPQSAEQVPTGLALRRWSWDGPL